MSEVLHKEGEIADAGTDAAQSWSVKVGEDVYGPYSEEAVLAYIAEGRIAAHSILAPEGSTGWKPAKDWEAFSGRFAEEKPDEDEKPAAPEQGEEQRDGSGDAPSEETVEAVKAADMAAAATRERPAYGPKKGQINRRAQPESANFLIVMDIKARYSGPLEEAVMSLGPAFKLAPNVWLINTDNTAPGLLNQLSQFIGKTDTMFIVDATRDRTAWFNLGPETDTKVRRVWKRPQ